MTTRRTFLKQAGLITPAMLLLPDALLAAAKPKNVGLQLYTLRELISKDPRGVIEKVAAAGYKEVELFGLNNGSFFGIPVAEFAALLKSHGLKAISGHYMPAKFLFADTEEGTREINDMIGHAVTMGNTYFTIPWLPAEKRSSLDDYKKIAAKLNTGAELAKKAGLKFAYHNHDFEFKSYDGTTGFDILTRETDKDLVKFELDIYWVAFSGIDTVSLFNQLKGRVPLWHVKDMDKVNRSNNTEIGNGTIDYSAIFKAAKISGMKHFFVEQETNYVPDPISSVEASIKYIKAKLI